MAMAGVAGIKRIGEPDCPVWRLSHDLDHWRRISGPKWTEVAWYVQKIDPYHHPATMHPGEYARDSVTDETVIDFDMLQTGHGGTGMEITGLIAKFREGYARVPDAGDYRGAFLRGPHADGLPGSSAVCVLVQHAEWCALA